MISVPDGELLGRAVGQFMGGEAGADYLGMPGVLVFVATEDEEVTGWCWGAWIGRPDGTSMVYLHQVEVAESHRRQGIARGLVTAFMAAGRELGAAKMFLTTGAYNTPAQKLYTSLGGGRATQGETENYWFLL